MKTGCISRGSMKRSRLVIRPTPIHRDFSQTSESRVWTSVRIQASSSTARLRWRACFKIQDKWGFCTRNGEQIRAKADVNDSLGVQCENGGNISESMTLPPPPPQPVYSVHRRILPSSLTAMSSEKGRRYLLESFVENTADSYWNLTEHFLNQSEPAYCGVTTLVMVLNSMSVDPGVRWRGGWRYYGSEEVLLDRCCFSIERVRRIGINMEEFSLLGRCHGLDVEMKRPAPQCEKGDMFSLESFRNDLRETMTSNSSNSVLVAPFSRSHLDQTGEGHFSPVAAYHEKTDQVLLLDVARFKYPPYWVPLDALYNAMIPVDSSTNCSRGWFLLHPPKSCNGDRINNEARRPAELVPEVGEKDACPIGKVKRRYCRGNREK